MKVKIDIIIYIFCLGISSTFAQWELRYPPQPTVGINDIYFLNQSNGFAVNSSGSILKTVDGGNHWSIVKHLQRDNLTEIKFVDNQNGFILSPHSFIGDSKDFVFTTDGGNEWQTSYIGLSDALTFLPLSNSEIIKSGDQGTIAKLDNFYGLWSEKYRMSVFIDWDIYAPFGDIKQFEKLNSGRILALGSSWRAFQYNVISDSVAFLLFSDDDGSSWDTLWCDLPKILTTFSFANNKIGWIGGKGNEIYKTTDGGISWHLNYSELLDDQSTSISKISVLDSLKMLAVTTKGKIISTSNGGSSWELSSDAADAYYESFYNIYFVNDQKGFVFGPDLWTTTTGGSSWSKVDTSIKPTFSKIQFINTKLGFGIGGGQLYGGSSFYKTSNGGFNWERLYDGNPDGSFQGFFMSDSLKGWLTKYDSLLKTTDGGSHWSSVYVDTLLEFMRGVEFFNDQLGVLFEARQRFNDYTLNYLTTDGGNTWQKYQMSDQKFLTSFLKIKRTDPSHIWVVNQQGVWLSRDTVKTWENVNPDIWGWAAAFDFSDSLNGWVAHLDGQQNKIKFTSDGGITWHTIMKPYMVQSQDLVIDGRDYFGRLQVTVAGLYGSLFRFSEDTDYGYEQTSYTNNWFNSIAVYREGNFLHKWVAGTGGTVLYNRDYLTDVEEDKTVTLTDYHLAQNYPNPFNPSTTIKYSIPNTSTASVVAVKLIIYDLLGNEINTLVNEDQPTGSYEVEFDPLSENRQLTSGVYFYRLRAGKFTETKKMLFLK